jgi:effector-binding domain-containing protein
MGETCEFENLPAQHTAYIRARTPVSALPGLIAQSYGKIGAIAAEKGLQISGPPYALYFNMDMQDLDVELGFPVSAVFEDGLEVRSGEIPAGKYASCIHKGPYSTVESAYQTLTEWISGQVGRPSGIAYEFYLNDPTEVPESELLTKLMFPILEG